MLGPEDNEGNTEYKRHLVNLENKRIEELSTQMKFRLEEGNGIAIYYIGINDDGTGYKMSEDQINESLTNFNLILNKINGEIFEFEQFVENEIVYFKITIVYKACIYDEKKIVLIGPSGSGKSTFLSNIILNKTENDNEARLYIMNHKHELLTKKTSSFNYHYLLDSNNKYVFMEAPGSFKYIKTFYKILMGTHPDLLFIFKDKNGLVSEYYENICSYMNIPYILINIWDENSEYYCKKQINKENLLKDINNKISNKQETKADILKLNILNMYPNTDLGIVISGYLMAGTISVYQTVYLLYESDTIMCKVKSIHVNSEPVKKINKKQIMTICLESNEKIKKSYRYGIISNDKDIRKNRIYFHLCSDNKKPIINTVLRAYCDNRSVTLSNIKQITTNIYVSDITNYFKLDNYIIIDNDIFGFIKDLEIKD